MGFFFPYHFNAWLSDEMALPRLFVYTYIYAVMQPLRKDIRLLGETGSDNDQ